MEYPHQKKMSVKESERESVRLYREGARASAKSKANAFAGNTFAKSYQAKHKALEHSKTLEKVKADIPKGLRRK